MVRVNNSDTIKRILNDAGIQTSIDDVPQELGSKIVPVLISNPERVGKTGNAGGIGASAVAHTASLIKDTYVTSAHISYSKLNTNTGTVIDFRYTSPEGTTEALLKMSLTTSIADTRDFSVSFPIPIKIKRGSTITANINNATGLRMDCGISYFEV